MRHKTLHFYNINEFLRENDRKIVVTEPRSIALLEKRVCSTNSIAGLVSSEFPLQLADAELKQRGTTVGVVKRIIPRETVDASAMLEKLVPPMEFESMLTA